MKITNPAIKTVKELLNNTAENFFYGTHIVKHCALCSKFYALGFKAL